jgi:hypothetical protein
MFDLKCMLFDIVSILINHSQGKNIIKTSYNTRIFSSLYKIIKQD